jgi:DNA-binding response OmpR family regulator
MSGVERILILEDDAAFAQGLSEILSQLGQSRFTSYPERLPEIIQEFQPTLLIVDYNLNHPTLNGIKATRLVRQNPDSNLLPVLLLSGEDDLGVIEEAYKSGIDDYVLKPVIPRFLVAKIENLLFQTRKKLNAQALSGLPGNAAIETEFYLRSAKRRPFSVAYTDLDNFKPFNDEKGVKMGDDAIQAIAQILYQLRAEATREDLFIGHLGGDDFFLLGGKAQVRTAARKLQLQFEAACRRFFSNAELSNGHYRGTDRQGQFRFFPLLTISTAVIDGITKDSVADFLQLTQLASVAKKVAKKAVKRITHFEASTLKLASAEKSLFADPARGAKKNTPRRRTGTK